MCPCGGTARYDYINVLGYICSKCGNFFSQEEYLREKDILQNEFDEHIKKTEENGGCMVLGDVFGFNFSKRILPRIEAARNNIPYNDDWKWNEKRGHLGLLDIEGD